MPEVVEDLGQRRQTVGRAEAFEITMWCLAGSYLSSLTPSTIVTSSFFAGAVMITFLAPAVDGRRALSRR